MLNVRTEIRTPPRPLMCVRVYNDFVISSIYNENITNFFFKDVTPNNEGRSPSSRRGTLDYPKKLLFLNWLISIYI